jgi:hypothetical protein
MMKSKAILFLSLNALLMLLLSPNRVSAQQLMFHDTLPVKHHWEINYRSDLSGKTSGLPLDFVNRFRTGGYLEDAYKRNAINRLSDLNQLGGDFVNSLMIRYHADTLFKIPDVEFGFRWDVRNHFSALFNRDAFVMMFMGNSEFEDATAKLSPTQFLSLNYAQVGFTLGKTWTTKTTRQQVNLGLSYLRGINFTSVNLNRANLTTGLDGFFVSADVNGNYSVSDTSHKSNYFSGPARGNGFSVDLFYQFYESSKGKLIVSAQDVGFINWKNSIGYALDTTLRFDGIYIDNLFQLNDSILQLSVDSLLSLNPEGNLRRSRTALPAWITMEYQHHGGFEDVQLIAGIRYRYQSAYAPLIYAGGNFILAKNHQVRTTLGWGGYGKLNWALFYRYAISNKLFITAGSQNVEGFISPERGTGQGLFLSTIFYFR